VDDSPHISGSPADAQDDSELDQWLWTWFQLRLAGPVPAHILDLFKSLDDPSGK
jgi:hypothetical protein